MTITPQVILRAATVLLTPENHVYNTFGEYGQTFCPVGALAYVARDPELGEFVAEHADPTSANVPSIVADEKRAAYNRAVEAFCEAIGADGAIQAWAWNDQQRPSTAEVHEAFEDAVRALDILDDLGDSTQLQEDVFAPSYTATHRITNDAGTYLVSNPRAESDVHGEWVVAPYRLESVKGDPAPVEYRNWFAQGSFPINDSFTMERL